MTVTASDILAVTGQSGLVLPDARPCVPRARLLRALALCVAILAAGEVAAAPLKVVGRFLQDTHGNNIMMRGVDLPVYKSDWVDDLDAVAAAIAITKTNAVRLEWWAVPPNGKIEYTVANLDRAIFANTITAFWTRADVRVVLMNHQDHMVINTACCAETVVCPQLLLARFLLPCEALRFTGANS